MYIHGVHAKSLHIPLIFAYICMILRTLNAQFAGITHKLIAHAYKLCIVIEHLTYMYIVTHMHRNNHLTKLQISFQFPPWHILRHTCVSELPF